MGIASSDKNSRQAVARQLHAWAVAGSRQSDLYILLGVADTVAGRFEMLLLHVCLLIRRLRRAGPVGVDLGQALFDTFVSDLDGALREMGVGDLAVPKQMRAMTKMFYGRAEALGIALSAASPEAALQDLFVRTVFQDHSRIHAQALAAYAIRLEQRLARGRDSDLLEGRVDRSTALVSDINPIE